MVSSTAQSERRRRNKHKKMGRKNRKQQEGTPVFPVQPEGYDLNAPDAKKAKS